MATGLLTAAVAIASASVSVAAAPLPAGPASAPVPVIVRGAPGSLAAVDRDITEAGGRVAEQIPLITASAAEVPASALGWLGAQPCIVEVTPDGPVQLMSSSYSPTTNPGSLYSIEQSLGVDQAWQDGYTGSGVGVALIDTGVTPVEGLDGAGQIVNGPDLSFDGTSPSLRYLDENGHGTFMAGIIAGRDPAAVSGHYAGDSTDFLGIAPDAHIINVKVGGANGAVDVSQVLAAIDWVVEHRDDEGFNIRVLNLSFGTDSSQSYLLDPLAYAAEVAWHQGIVVVASVGNQGGGAQRVSDPAIDPYVIAVGASQTSSTDRFSVASFSSHGNATRSPDLIAPGTSVVSLADPGSVIADQYASTGAVGTRFFRGSGTSEAAAVVSGLAALLVQEHPQATPDQIKALLTSTAAPVAGGARRASGSGEAMASSAVQAPLPAAVQSFAELDRHRLAGGRPRLSPRHPPRRRPQGREGHLRRCRGHDIPGHGGELRRQLVGRHLERGHLVRQPLGVEPHRHRLGLRTLDLQFMGRRPVVRGRHPLGDLDRDVVVGDVVVGDLLVGNVVVGDVLVGNVLVRDVLVGNVLVRDVMVQRRLVLLHVVARIQVVARISLRPLTRVCDGS